MKCIVIKTGVRQDGSYWCLVQREEGDFVVAALIATKTEKTVGEEITIPTTIAKNMTWK